MLRNNIRYAEGCAELHGCAASPLATMCMNDVRFAVGCHIFREQLLRSANPAFCIQAVTLGNAPHIRLIDADAVHLPKMVTVRQGHKFTNTFLDRELHIADDRHTMAQGLQRLGLLQAELAAIGREKGRNLNNMHSEWNEKRDGCPNIHPR